MKHFPGKSLILIAISSAAATLLLADAAFLLLNKHRKDTLSYDGGYARDGFFQADELLGYKPKPGLKIVSIKKSGDRVLYNVTYSIDRYGRRITLLSGTAVPGRPILFFGCSYTFGEGVADDETLPFYVSRSFPGSIPLNYGCPGYGPQEMLAKLQSGDLGGEVTASGPVLIYTFMDDHVNRAIGSLHVCTRWGKDMPYYCFNANGNLERRGSFASGRPALSRLYNAVSKVQFIDYFLGRIDYPIITDSHIRLTAEIIRAAAAAFRERFKSDDFYVVFFPGSSRAGKLIPYLQKSGVRYFDYSRLADMNDPSSRISRYDRHPTAAVYRAVAEKLAKDLKGEVNWASAPGRR